MKSTQQWLDGLQTGDEVMVCGRADGHLDLALVKVARRTPTGRIVLDDGRTFRPDGTQLFEWLSPASLAEPCATYRMEMRKIRIAQRLRRIHWTGHSLEQLERVLEVLGEHPEGGTE